MKTVNALAFVFLIVLASIVTSCKEDSKDVDKEETGKTGTFSINGIKYTGETETQTFGNGNYSVVCEQDDPYNFVQITFHSKAEAETGGTFKVEDYGINVESGTVHVGTMDVITGDPAGEFTVTVTNKRIVLGSIKIISTGSSSASATINSADIKF